MKRIMRILILLLIFFTLIFCCLFMTTADAKQQKTAHFYGVAENNNSVNRNAAYCNYGGIVNHRYTPTIFGSE